jgi:hypothetical protein
MVRIDPQLFAFASPLWIAAGSAALLVMIVCALAFRRSRPGSLAATGRFFLVLLGAALAGSLTWAFFDSVALRDRAAERTALEMRAEGLTAQSLASGSPLACLDPLADDIVQEACETAVFASPASVAAAISYVTAQFALLSDMTAYSKRGGSDIGAASMPLRRALEADPFGFVADMLVRRDGCTAEKCPAFALLSDPNHVRTNMIAQTLQHYVDHYREVWARSADGAVAAVTAAVPTSAADAAALGKRKTLLNIDFPSAASIPPVSIMNPEPKAPANAEAARKRGEKSAAHDAVDPVWKPAPAQAAQ